MFEQKTIVVTGGLGEVGRTICEKFLEDGALVICVDLEKEVRDGIDYITNIQSQYNDKFIVYACDIASTISVELFAKKLAISNIIPDVLINNAGINRLVDACEITEEIWDEVIDVNLKGTFFMSKYLGKMMIENGGGCIVNISSQHGVVGNYHRVPYCSSKAGIVNMTRALCLEWADYNVRVNCVLPTYILTKKNEQWLMKTRIYRKYVQAIPPKRYCTTSDVANAVFFLASDDASMITGHALAVDGGYLAQ